MSEINNIHARLKRAFEKRGVDFSGEGQVNDTNPIMYQRAFNILKRKGADFSTPSGHPSFDSIRGVNGRHFPHQKVPNAFVANPNWNGYGKVELGGSSNAPLTFTANTPGSTIKFRDVLAEHMGTEPADIDMEISTDNGSTWTAYTLGDAITLANAGDSVMFRGDNPTGFGSADSSKLCGFAGEGSLAGSGNIMTIIDKTGVSTSVPDSGFTALFEDLMSGTNEWLTSSPDLTATTIGARACEQMFAGCANLVNAPALPATELAENCYDSMFKNCTSLVNAPELPATELADGCYTGMFEGCTSLINAPALPVTELTVRCYIRMFSGCTSLVNVPDLPATVLTEQCYEGMFSGCTSLVNVPDLPATELAEECYKGMFSGCTSLVNAPNLPATVLAVECYERMFSECASLVNVPDLPATELATGCSEYMFYGCASLVNAPALPATKLAERCYGSMFQSCANLVNAPALPATELAEACYEGMFRYCTSLVNAPALPASATAEKCYKNMFFGCTSLVNGAEIFATEFAEECYNRMFTGCSNLSSIKLHYTGNFGVTSYSNAWLSEVKATGDAYFNGTCSVRNSNTIPAGWTIHTF